MPEPAQAAQKPNALQALIVDQIAQSGPVSVSHYMALSLSHPRYGYYATKLPLGKDGDFITAPEISQMFGEIVAVSLAQHWLAQGSPSVFHLVECGPGRGTLITDILRVMEKVQGLPAALHIHLVEISPALQQMQQQALQKFANVTWHQSIATLPRGCFALVANEFLDALPVDQLIFHQGEWRERLIGVHNGVLAFTQGKTVALNAPAVEGMIVERSAIQQAVVEEIAQRVQRDSGLAVLVDYGSEHSGHGDTLQAMRNHSFANVLENPGEQDLTTHVDFEALARVAAMNDCDSKIVTQREFLVSNGIEARAEILQAKNPDVDVLSALYRLTSAKEMGDLFKVMTITKKTEISNAAS